MVFAQGMRQLLIGLAIGLAASFALTRVLAALVVVQVRPADPVTYLTVALVLILAGAIGSAIPAPSSPFAINDCLMSDLLLPF